MGRKSKQAYGLLVVLVLLLQWSARATAHTFGTAGYSEIVIRDSTIEYALLLDYDQLIGYLPIDDNGDGKVSEKEFSQKELIKMFILDHITVSVNGAGREPEVVGASAVGRNDLSLIRFDFRYPFQEPIRNYQVDYHLYFDSYDTDHKNFATVQSGASKSDKIFTKGSHILKGTVENEANAGETNVAQPLQTGRRTAYGYLAALLGSTILVVLFAILKARRKTAAHSE